ncbi:MAG: hypothetical protein ACKV2T_28885 [Kofleriaceae bacterium]
MITWIGIADAQPTEPTEQPPPEQPAPPEIAPAPAPAVQPDPETAELTETPPEEEAESKSDKLRRNFAGSVQLDYMSVPSEKTGRMLGLDGATAEVSLKIAMDFNHRVSANVKTCLGCHGVEVGMAYFDLRIADEFNIRVGRFTPAFGEFPLRHDPANHRTSDKPLPYDMGRMLRITEWNEGVLPAPWVDNGIEINGTHFFGERLQLDYAAYAIGGPRAGADPLDFDFKQSRSGESYYVDNNSRPTLGAQVVASFVTETTTISAGLSYMGGTYDPEHRLPFSIGAAHLVLRARDIYIRAEYVTRRTKMSLGEDPSARFKYGPGAGGMYDPYFVKDGGYLELEIPLTTRLTVIAREDGLRRRGNTSMTSDLRSDSAVLRHTGAIALVLHRALRLKASYEYVDFSDFEDESVIHLGIAGPF